MKTENIPFRLKGSGSVAMGTGYLSEVYQHLH